MKYEKVYSLVEVPPRYLMMLSRAICKQTSIFYNKSIILWVIVVWLTCKQAWVGPLRGKVGEHVWDTNSFIVVSPPVTQFFPFTCLLLHCLLSVYHCLLMSAVHFCCWSFLFLISNISVVKVSESKPVFCLWERKILTFT